MNPYIEQYSHKSKKMSTAEKDSLIIEYSPLIRYIALRIAVRLPPHIEIDDLISAGVIGLIDAIEKYDPSKETKFRTYAEIRIKGAILDELRSLDWVPRTVRQRANNLASAYAELEQELGRAADDEEIAKYLGIGMEEFQETLINARGIPFISIEDLGGKSPDGEKRDLLECLAGTKDADPQTLARMNEIKEIIARSIDELPKNERLLVSLYYYEDLTMKEIGEVMGITESRVSQIHTKAVLRLKGKLKRFLED
ncbi:MAG: FliA/WhiG family RNA polymerase sigma factor [Nitrospinota bacterium]